MDAWPEIGISLIKPQNMSNKNILVAFIAAAATGASIALLLAPDEGKMTRKKLVKRVTSVKDTLTYILLQAEDIVEHLQEKVGNKATLSEPESKITSRG